LAFPACSISSPPPFWASCSGFAEGTEPAKPLFLFSILYLFLIFLAMIADRLLFIPVV
jgi:heme O synthase-like polyprenyltransferase